jgi:hypothetical protein
MKLTDLGFWNTPMGARPVTGARDELGNPVYQDVAGNQFNVMPAPAQEQGPGLLDMLAGIYRLAGGRGSEQDQAAATGLLGAVTQGLTAPGRAAQGEMVTNGDVWSTALDYGAMGAPMTAPEGAIRAGAMRDPRFWHPASDIKLQMPIDEMQFGVTDLGRAQPQTTLDIAALQDELLVATFGDRTRADAVLGSINNNTLAAPVPLQGGADFMRTDGGLWASEPAAMARQQRAIARLADQAQQTPVLAYTSMGAQSGDFSRMMSDAVMGQMTPEAVGRINPDAAARYDAAIRRTNPAWPGIRSPNIAETVASMPGTQRRELWQEMDKGVYREAGFPDVGAARLAITDPRLLSAQPFDTGLTMGRVDPSLRLSDTPPDVHATYGSQIDGQYLGGLLSPVPGEMIWRDFFNTRRAQGLPSASDQRAFMMTPGISQRVDAQMIDEVSRYLEGLQQ